MTASVCSPKLATEGDEFRKDLLCTTYSRNIPALQQPYDSLSPNVINEKITKSEWQKHDVLPSLSVAAEDVDMVSQNTVNLKLHGKQKVKRKNKDKKRKRDDPEYLEKKWRKKEKQKEKEMVKLLNEEWKFVSDDGHRRLKHEKRLFSNAMMALSIETLARHKIARNLESDMHRPWDQETPLEPTMTSRSWDDFNLEEATVRIKPNGPKLILKTSDSKPAPPEGSSGSKLSIKLQTRK